MSRLENELWFFLFIAWTLLIYVIGRRTGYSIGAAKTYRKCAEEIRRDREARSQ